MKRLEFEPSPALRNMVGEGLKTGQKLELMGEFKVKENGDWCLVAVEGVAMPGYEEHSPSEPSNYVRSAMEHMPKGVQ